MGDGKEEKNGRPRLPSYTLDMEDFKEKSSNMAATSVGIFSALLLWGTLDPYWEFQQLVEYSKDLHACMDSVELE